MSSQTIKNARIAKEIRTLNTGYRHHGFNCEAKEDYLAITLPGPKDTIHENQIYNLNVKFEDTYPFTPPKLQLLTPIYHPNIDKDGKICLNILKMPPDGSYNPTMTLESIIVSVQLLISVPNPYDPLRSDAASDFILNKEVFEDKVRRQIEENKKAAQH